jgi:hypothetical protein
MSAASTTNRNKTVVYLSLLAVQVLGATFVELNGLAGFRELVLNPGKQLASTPYDSYGVIAVLCAMQFAYWYRLFRVPIPFHGPKL